MITKDRTVDDMWQAALQAQMPNQKGNRPAIFEKVQEKKRRKNAVASQKYSKTEKGKKANRVKCHNYFSTHRESFKRRVQDYQARFKAAYGLSLMSWNYWLRKLNKNQCAEEDIPEKYSRVLHDWKTHGGYAIDRKS